jgi:crotonobetainyl-CoA:carnitine CoA-transferase CaiB-like acyl-CoA transferase
MPLDQAKALLATADVLVENNRCGVMERLGVGYEAVHALNPGLLAELGLAARNQGAAQ